MAASTTDDFLILTVGDDVVGVNTQKTPAIALLGIGHSQTTVGGTQCMPLSAPHTCLRHCRAVHAYGRDQSLAARTKAAFQPPAQW